jgi:hypothetical protein
MAIAVTWVAFGTVFTGKPEAFDAAEIFINLPLTFPLLERLDQS